LKNHVEKRTRLCPLWGGVKDEWIEGLGGARVRELGVNSVTDDSSDVVGSVSSKQMGEGPGKGGRTDFTEVTDNSEDTTERLATDSGSGILLAILVVDTDRAGSSAVTNGDVSSLSQTTDSTLGLVLESTETLFVASNSEEHTYGSLVKRRDAWQRCEGHD
jgi:hypothetical protein